MADYKLTNGKTYTPPTSARSMTTGAKRHKNIAGAAQRPRSGVERKLQKSAEAIPIHAEGNQDELSDVDPDLTLAELDLRLLMGEGHGSLSGQGTGRYTESAKRTQVACGVSQREGSRARPLKPHETEPFLAIGTISRCTDEPRKSTSLSAGRPKTKERPHSMQSGNSRSPAGRATPTSNSCISSRRATPTSNSYISAGRATPTTLRVSSCTYRSPYSSPSPSLRSHSAKSRGRRTPGRVYISPNAVPTQPNPRVKMPFKHDIRRPAETPSQEPSQELKEMTALATYHVHRVLASERGSRTVKQKGRLQKGRLKPLYPVQLNGPSITQCRGILSETRSYSSSRSRAMQRGKQLMAQLRSCDIDLYAGQGMVRGDDSVHRVSAASSVDEEGREVVVSGDESDAQSSDCMEQDSTLSQFLEEDLSELETQDMSDLQRDDTATGPLSTSGSAHQDGEKIQNGDGDASPPFLQASNSQQRQTVKMKDVCPGNSMNTSSAKLTLSEEREEDCRQPGSLQTTSNSNNANNNFIADTPSGKSSPQIQRPHSASVQYSIPVSSQSRLKDRPRTATSSKTVRFAHSTWSSDGKQLPLAHSNSSAGGEKGTQDKDQTSKKTTSGPGCKPSDWKENGRKDDDDGDDSKDGGGGGVRRVGRGQRGGGETEGSRRQAGNTTSNTTSSHQNQSPSDQNQQVEETLFGSCRPLSHTLHAEQQAEKIVNKDAVQTLGSDDFKTRQDDTAVVNNSTDCFQCANSDNRAQTIKNKGSLHPPLSKYSPTENLSYNACNSCGPELQPTVQHGIQSHARQSTLFGSNNPAVVQPKEDQSKPGTSPSTAVGGTINQRLFTEERGVNMKVKASETDQLHVMSREALQSSRSTQPETGKDNVIKHQITQCSSLPEGDLTSLDHVLPSQMDVSSHKSLPMLHADSSTPVVLETSVSETSMSAPSSASSTSPSDNVTEERVRTVGGLKALPPPPVTWPTSVDIGEKVSVTHVPDSASLLQLLLEVSAQVEGESSNFSNPNTSVSNTTMAVAHYSGEDMTHNTVSKETADNANLSNNESSFPLSQIPAEDNSNNTACELGENDTINHDSDQKEHDISSTSKLKNIIHSSHGDQLRIRENGQHSKPGTTNPDMVLEESKGLNCPGGDYKLPDDVVSKQKELKRLSHRKKKAAPAVTVIMQDDNPRVGVFAYQHDDSASTAQDSQSMIKAQQDGEEHEGKALTTQGGGDSDVDSMKKALIALDIQADRADSETTEQQKDTSVMYPGQGIKSCLSRKDKHGNSLTDLLMHFALGVDTTMDSVKKKNMQIVERSKKNIPAAGASVRAFVLNEDTGKERDQGKRKSAGKRQTFTHHSSQPFVYSTHDQFSQAVATHLKYGDSPYLKDMKPPVPHSQQTKDREREAVSKQKDCSSGQRHKTRKQGEGHSGVKKGVGCSQQYHRPTRVKFADFSIQTFDINQNQGEHDQDPRSVLQDYAGTGQDSTFLTQFHGDGDYRQHMLALQYNGNNNHSIHGHFDEDCLDRSEVYSDEYSGTDSTSHMVDEEPENIDARFGALEAELSAVRSEIRNRILDSQAQVLLEDMQDDDASNHTEPLDEEADEEEDDFVYEDDGTSDEDETEAGKEVQNNNRQQAPGEDDDIDNAYYRELLLEYRRKCMMVGEGNLVISDKIIWPFAGSHPTPSAMDNKSGVCSRAMRGRPQSANCLLRASAGHQHNMQRPYSSGRPQSAGAFLPLSERRQGHGRTRSGHSMSDSTDQQGLHRTYSCSDSGWESDQVSDIGGRQWDRSNSLLSVDGESVLSGSSNKCAAGEGHSSGSRQTGRAGEMDGKTKEHVLKSASRPPSGREECPQFSIVAASIPISATRSKVTVPKDAPAAPFPPLCFNVNARPPPGFLFYFAYATYMNPDRLAALLGQAVDKRYWALLMGFDLTFNARGSDESSGGLANIVFNPFMSVEGCVFVLTPDQLDKLDAFTGAPKNYGRVVVPVWMSDAKESGEDAGMARYCVPAVTYIAHSHSTMADGCSPNEYVASQCLKGADLLTPSYCDRLRSLVSGTSLALPQAVVS